ncbi:MAG: ribosome small subunit-dependent GTPase A [Chitinispirillales bacterium]|jgi:ribosome biogenesis GTPase|nr:ribosome small subunit-dependent GTPase A [Chitinispirillales bacterium]
MFEHNSLLKGRVTEEQKNYFVVSTPQSELRCVTKGTLKKRKTRIFTGDRVQVQVLNHDSMEGVICEVEERKNFLPRPPLANLSQVVFINSFKHPRLDCEAIDRFLFSSAAYGIDAIIVFNKTDLLSVRELNELEVIENSYKNTGYKTMRTSAAKRYGVDELLNICKNKTSAFTGLSGVGKSTLLSIVFPDREFRTSEVSGTHGRGTHTTTHIKLLPLDKNSFLADTPGFAFVDVPVVPPESVASYFPEIERVTGKCRFNNCIHDAEPGCRVRELIEENEIASWRHEHYLKLYYEMAEWRKKNRASELGTQNLERK